MSDKGLLYQSKRISSNIFLCECDLTVSLVYIAYQLFVGLCSELKLELSGAI